MDKENKILLLSLGLALLAVAGCKSKKEVADPVATAPATTSAVNEAPQLNPNDTVLYYDRGACFGMCPMFSLVVYADGRGVYLGKNHVNRIGLYQSKVNDAALQNIVDVARKIGYFGMQEVYDNPSVTDLPTIKTAVYADGKLKRVAGRYKAPQSLKTLYTELDSLIENQNWTRVNDKN
jgi:hypothetical protein